MDRLLFVPLTKVVVEKREVWGRATQEVPDKGRVQEIFDYDTSVPLFKAWSNDAQQATKAAGQEVSLGNLRSMHKNISAGKLIAIDYNDTAKAIDIGTVVVDDAEWEKCLKGVYTGFSVGGDYANRWPDPANAALTRYTAKPTEISLVDNPAVPTARFSLVKADGIVEEHEFQKVAERSDTSKKEGESKYGDVKFADETNKKYPIDTEQHIRAAWNYINKEKNAAKYSSDDVAAIKKKIVAAWKSKISKEGPPSAEGEKDAEKFATDTLGKYAALYKSLSDVSSFASLLSSLQWIVECSYYELESEGDDSLVPEQLKTWLEQGVNVFKDMAAEESDELVGRFAEKAARAGALQKAGARHSKADQNMVQGIHDSAVGLGADCGDDMDKAARAELRKSADESLAKISTLEKSVTELTTERDTLKKRVTELEAEPAPAKGKLKTVTVDKSDDTGGAPVEKSVTVEELMKLPEHERALLLMKASQERPRIAGAR